MSKRKLVSCRFILYPLAMSKTSTTARLPRPFVATPYFSEAGNAACQKAWDVADECEAEYYKEENQSAHRAFYTGALMSQIEQAHQKIALLENRVKNLLAGED
jgi:hypothetical protein